MKRDSYKSFSSKVADSTSPYKPLKVVPKDSPLTPWKPKPQKDGLQTAQVVSKDSPLVALGKDGKPLDTTHLSEQIKKNTDDKCIPFICRMRREPKRVFSCGVQNQTNDQSLDYFNKLFYEISSKDTLSFYMEIDKRISKILKIRDTKKIEVQDNKIKIYEGPVNNPARIEQFFKRMSKSTILMPGDNSAPSTIYPRLTDPFPKWTAPTLTRTPPPWYYGFIYESYIKIEGVSINRSSSGGGFSSFNVAGYARIGKYQPEVSVLGFQFLGNPMFTPRVTRCDFSEKVDFLDVIYNAIMSDDDSKLLSLLKLLGNSSYHDVGVNDETTPLLIEVKPELKYGACREKDTVAFNHIEIGVEYPGDEIQNISSIKVVLNDVEIYSWEAYAPGWDKRISFGNPLVLDDDIRIHKLSRVGLSAIPRPGSPDSILAFAAKELGQSWHTKRPGQWNLYYSNRVKWWEPVFESWCADFALYAFQNTTPHMHQEIFQNKYYPWISDFVDKYIDHYLEAENNRKYNYKTWPWDIFSRVASQLVQPGFYAKVDRTGHSTFFIEWVGGFQEGSDKNMFKSIGGNQNYRVNIKNYTLRPAKLNDLLNNQCPIVSWSRYCQHYSDPYYPDGFIDMT